MSEMDNWWYNQCAVISRRNEELNAKVAALEAENGRLKAPVSDAEWEAANYRQAVETGLGESSTDGKMLVWHTYTRRDKFDALIAARAQQSSPAQDKEQG